MRKFIVGLVGGLVALAGFAGSASASATIDLIWANSGTSTTSVLATDTGIVLEVWLTAGLNGSQGAGVSVDYSTLCVSCVSAFAPNPGGPLPFPLGTTTDTGLTTVGTDQQTTFPHGDKSWTTQKLCWQKFGRTNCWNWTPVFITLMNC